MLPISLGVHDGEIAFWGEGGILFVGEIGEVGNRTGRREGRRKGRKEGRKEGKQEGRKETSNARVRA